MCCKLPGQLIYLVHADVLVILFIFYHTNVFDLNTGFCFSNGAPFYGYLLFMCKQMPIFHKNIHNYGRQNGLYKSLQNYFTVLLLAVIV